ncbi:hypothetical protein L9F63_014599 [Diploptera punctata]|uniref:Uncharacterized protein n=1 Tax=Diploptera punctata TaxID=6984 RepID=A0AAD8A7U1_DIPPU|nr:hypothetical protein L9F63_014599 [Diploptera punctata]
MDLLQCVLSLTLVLSSASGVPVRYDQRQEGDLNVHAHLENFVIVLIPSGSFSLADYVALRKQPVNKPSSGTKISAPDFPAGKSPYKVDIDISDGVDDDKKEVIIAQVPAALIASSQVKSEGELVQTTSSETETTTPPATEKLSTINSDKKENSVQKTQIKKDGENNENKEEIKEDQTTEQKPTDNDEEAKPPVDNNEESKPTDNTEKSNPADNSEKSKPADNNQKSKPADNNQKSEPTVKNEQNVKLDNVPVIDFKPSKAPKSIEFGLDAAKPRVQKVADIDLSSRVKYPIYSQDVGTEPDMRLKMLRTGLEGCEPGEVMTEDGECLPAKFKQRSGSYFSTEDRLLPILQFGVSPASD